MSESSIARLIFEKLERSSPGIDVADRASSTRSRRSRARSNARADQMRAEGSPRGRGRKIAHGGAR